MRILSAAETRALDQFTIQHEPISSIDLMERAADRFTSALLNRFPDHPEFLILAGMGNNGGDGLAVARLLSNNGKLVLVSILKHAKTGSADFQINLERLEGSRNVELYEVEKADEMKRSGQAIVIDAILGSGLTRSLSGFLKDVVEEVNSWPNIKVSVDIPTGLFADDNSENTPDGIFRCDHCITFHAPKQSFLVADHAALIPSFEVVDIGLIKTAIGQISRSNDHYLAMKDLARFMKPRAKFSHKGSFGHALLLAGSKGKAGAAILAGKACLRSGAGLLTMKVPEVNLSATQSAFPEAMCLTDKGHSIRSVPNVESYNAIGVGPGIGMADEAHGMIRDLLDACKLPLVIDADALNIISSNSGSVANIPKNAVITPHPKEFDRLFGDSQTAAGRLKIQREQAVNLGIIIVLKGAHTSIALPNGEVWFNSTGNPGMATAGSGDVLTGVLLGLLSQGYDPPTAAKLGVFLHGMAGDSAAEKLGEESLIASDLIQELPGAFQHVRGIT